MDGPYLKPMTQAFTDAGIHYISSGLGNTATRNVPSTIGTLMDAARTGVMIKNNDGTDDWRVYPPASTNAAKQFNLIGYSYGSMLAAQTAKSYANLGYVVDHLVLIGSPIDADFLSMLKKHKNIKKVSVIDLTEHGDPIHAGMSFFDLVKNAPLLGKQMNNNKAEGHFYYAHVVPDSPRRWAELAKRIKNEGLE
ncbi:alpha/beta hydrolase [Acinetobacter proteolyticus]|uniref:alpha/beta hydrolase n=1 Tax=Acinetobacter proteolyticus TaxID=1776741 RepID=UPI003D963DD5